MSSQQDPSRCDDPPVSSSDMLDDPLTMSFADPAGSAGITVEGVAGLQTVGSKIDPIDQSSTLVMASTSHVVEASSISTACGGAIMATTSQTPESTAVTAPVDLKRWDVLKYFGFPVLLLIFFSCNAEVTFVQFSLNQ